MIEQKFLPKYNLTIPILKGDPEKDLCLFVSAGEYPSYDNDSYDYMQEDKVTEREYKRAIKKWVKDKLCLDIGTGRDMDWAMYALDYGSKHSVGVEVLESTYQLAKKELESHFYKDKLTLIHSLSNNYFPEELFDVIISEIIGNIGGSEGVAVALKDAQNRLLAKGGKMIPYKCLTKVGAICIREIPIAFHEETIPYLESIFEFNGGPFDLRLALSINKPTLISSTHGVIEDLNFEDGSLIVEAEEHCTIEMKKSTKIDGLLLWINLFADRDSKVIDSLYSRTSWETIYIPIWNEPIFLKKGTKINISCKRELSEDGVHPDYHFTCQIEGELFKETFSSYYKSNQFQTKQIYKELFQ